MAVESISFKICFRDKKGQVRCLTVNLNSASTPSSLVAGITAMVPAFQAVSNAGVGSKLLGNSFLPYGGAGDYQDVLDKARLVFRNANGERSFLEIPAPKKSIFLADQETVDSSQTDMAALLTTLAFITDRHGEVLTYVGGYRIRRRGGRRVTIFTLNPQETTPEGP